jgi:dsRNA-specific ribonuclease
MRAFTPFFAGTTQLIKAQKVFNVHRDCGLGRMNEALGMLVSHVICNRSGRKINLGHTQKLSYYEWRVCIIVCGVLVLCVASLLQSANYIKERSAAMIGATNADKSFINRGPF